VEVIRGAERRIPDIASDVLYRVIEGNHVEVGDHRPRLRHRGTTDRAGAPQDLHSCQLSGDRLLVSAATNFVRADESR